MKKNLTATSSYTIFQLSEWLDSLCLPHIPNDFIPFVKKLARVPEANQLKPEVYPEHHGIFFTFENKRPIIKNFSELSDELSIEKHHIPTRIHLMDSVQKKAQIYLQKIATRIYSANPEILGTPPPYLSIEPLYRQKKDKEMFFMTRYWPPRIQLNIYDLVNRYTSEDLLAWDIAHELIHLTLARQFVNRSNTPQEESVCDILGTLCMARAGYKPIESILEWADFISQKKSLTAHSILHNTINQNLSFENQYHIYDAYIRGLMKLPPQTAAKLHQTFKLMPPPDSHPNMVIRMLYTNEINNYLTEKNILSNEQKERNPIPIDPTLQAEIKYKMSMRVPIYCKKQSAQLKAKLLKRHQKRQKQYQ